MISYIKKSALISCGLFIAGTVGGCTSTDPEVEQPTQLQEQPKPTVNKVNKGMMTATVKYIDLEGGFYGLMTEDGQKLLPMNLPKEYLKEGTVIQFQAITADGMASTQQWGTMVELKSVKLISTDDSSDL